MSDVVGGKRQRFIRESLYQLLKQNLTDLGWFDAGRSHLPITFEPYGVDQESEISLNTCAISDENERETMWELGSLFSEETTQMYVDFYSESDALGMEFIGDVRDILRGRLSLSTDRNNTNFAVYDFGAATPPILFYCDIENVQKLKAHGFLKPWLQHWYSCSFEVVDAYSTEDD